MALSPQELVESVVREYDELANSRGVWESHWEEIAQRVVPSYSGAFVSRGLGQTPGAKRTQFIFDSTAPVALTRFAAAMESMLTPRSSKWHRLVPSESALMRDRETRLWLDAVNDKLFAYRYSPTANFASQWHQDYMSLGAFGSGCVFIDEFDKGPGLRYKHIGLHQAYFCENHQGIVDKVVRPFWFSARQARQKWGAEKLPKAVQQALEKTPEKLFMFIHCVRPREDVDPGRRDYRGMPFASYYVAHEGKMLMSEGGYNTFPYSVSRYVQFPGEVYGRSPAMDALPSIKTLNEEKKTVLKQGHRAVDPVLLVHDDGVVDSFSLKPGAVNSGAVSDDGRPLVHSLPVGDVNVGREMMADERAIINDAFLITLFQILIETPQMTATEVLERAREKGALLSPTMGRQQSEALGPLIERELDVLSRQGLLPPMPPALREAGGEISVAYDSPLSRAMKAEEVAGVFRTLELATNIAQASGDPSSLDHFDVDEIIPAAADINAVPPQFMRDPAVIQQIRQARAQAQQAQQAVEAAPAAASVVKTMQGANAA